MAMVRMSCVWFSSPSSFSSSVPISTKTQQKQLAFSSSSFFSPSKVALSIKHKQKQKQQFTCNALFGLGVPELVVIAGVVALVFGPKKLPEVGRSIGKTVKSFQQAAKEFETEIKKEPDSTGGGQSEKSISVSEQEKQDTEEVSSSKESV